MCGIAGILVARGARPPALPEVERMVAVLGHRGPDGHGFYLDERAALGHTRLSIVDLSGGAQPICNEDGSVWITVNGEIFNYPELRDELRSMGHVFRTRSDTEVIVHAYEQWGDGAWARFDGQFACAVWDAPRRRLALARDPVGILPLHYACNASSVVFASETKALFASGRVRPEFDPPGLLDVFTRWAVPAPRTVFAGVRSVRPGCVVAIDGQLRVREHAWWSPSFRPDPALRSITLDSATDALEHVLRKAVALRLRADVPVGAYLSGGLDSSLIATLIQRSESSPLQTFSIRFENPAFDETEPQRIMAARLGTAHHEVYVRDRDIAGHLPAVVRHCETPLPRTGAVPLFLLSDLVRRNGMKAVLTGEGADEFFAGYSIFKEDKIRRFWARQPGSAWRPALLSRIHHEVGGGTGGAQKNRMWREFFRRGLADTERPFYSHAVRWDNTAWGTRFLRRDLLAGVAAGPLDAELEATLPEGWRSWPPLGRAQMIEIATFMSPYLLAAQGDRVAMGHGVEARYPFLDPEVMDLAGRLPTRLKLSGLRDKLVLRALGTRHLPPEIAARPKQPYRAPTSSAFFGAGAPEYVRVMLSPEALESHGLVEPGPARRLAEKAWARNGIMAGEREEMALMSILTLQLLAEWIRRELPAGADRLHRRLKETPPSVLEYRSPVAAFRTHAN